MKLFHWRKQREAELNAEIQTHLDDINVYGRYFFPVSEEMSRKGLRPLRKPGEID